MENKHKKFQVHNKHVFFCSLHGAIMFICTLFGDGFHPMIVQKDKITNFITATYWMAFHYDIHD